ncbi:MAG: arylsulfatase [bacterium]|nr:arylsulfatase [bacterium]
MMDRKNMQMGNTMNRRGFLAAAGRTALGFAGLPAALSMSCAATGSLLGAGSARPGRRPNILVILADDMGFSDAGCYGGEIATPNLNRLANGGVRFTQVYSTGRCWPSRTCILTGYYPQQVHMDPPKGRLPAWTRVLPAYFKPLGYRCYHTGKWHLMGAPRPVADGGFDRFYCIEDHNRFFAPKNHLLDDRPLPPVAEGSGFYLTTAIADYGIDFLKEHASQHGGAPFYLYLAFTSPHFPLHAFKGDIDRYRQRYLEGWDAVRAERYRRQRQMGIVNCALSPLDPDTIPSWNMPEAELIAQIGPGEEGHAVPWRDLIDEQKHFQATKMAIHAAMVDRMDREIGRVLDQIKAMGAFEDTIIFFASDNGASAEQIIRGDGNDPAAPPGSEHTFLCLGPGWSTSSNTPFRLHKSWNHEGGIASPFIVHWPAGLRARGELRHTPGHFIDLLPTTLELVGGQPPAAGPGAPPLPGRSLAPALARDVAVTRDCLYFHHEQNRAIRVGDWKLVAKGKDGPWELYDLSTDRCELIDLARRYPDKVREMAAHWERLERQFREEAGPVAPLKAG